MRLESLTATRKRRMNGGQRKNVRTPWEEKMVFRKKAKKRAVNREKSKNHKYQTHTKRGTRNKEVIQKPIQNVDSRRGLNPRERGPWAVRVGKNWLTAGDLNLTFWHPEWTALPLTQRKDSDGWYEIALLTPGIERWIMIIYQTRPYTRTNYRADLDPKISC